MARSRKPVSGPLRKVLGNVMITHRMVTYRGTPSEEVFEHLFGEELLECGHTQMTRQDIYGGYYSPRRRCSKCKNGVAPQFTEEMMKRFHAGERRFPEAVKEY